MAFPNIPFTEEGRVKTAKVLGVIHWICVVPAVFCLVTALYIQLVISDQIYFIENYNGHILPGFLVFTGVFSLTGHILCGKVFWANHKDIKREKWAKFLLPAVVVTIFIFLVELIAGIVCIVHVGELEESLQSGILTAMKGYSNDLTTKEEMDMLQIEYECCGSKSYQDWFSVAWVHQDYLSKQAKQHKRLTNDDVPFSCCTSHVLRPCIYHHVHDNDKHYNYDYRVKTTLYKKGCAEKLMDFYENALLSNGGAIILGLSFIQLIVGAVGRIFQTALVNSQNSDDKEGESVGYLFGEIGSEKGAEFDTTTESVDTEATEDLTLDSSLGTEEAIEEPSTEATVAEEPAYLPMGGTEEPAYLPMGGTKEPIYENTRPYQDDEEPIYHDEEVEQYLLNKFNQSKHYFETLSPDELPAPSGSGVYEEPLPYPGDEWENSTGQIKGSSRHPSKGSVKKQSSTYVSFDPDPEARAAKQQEVIYANVAPGPPGHYDIPAYQSYVNNSSIAANNVSRNHSMSMKMGDYSNTVYARIHRSPLQTKRLSKKTGSSRSKSEYHRNTSNEPTSRFVNPLPKPTTQGIYGSFLQRSALSKVVGKNGKHVSRKSLTKSRTKSTKENRPYGSATEPLISDNVRSVYSNKHKDDIDRRRFSVKQQVQKFIKAPESLYQRIKRDDQIPVKANIENQERPTILPKGSNKPGSQSTQNVLKESDIQTTRVQPERFETNYKPNVNEENFQRPWYGSSNIRTSNMPFPEVRPQYHTVYQAKHSGTYATNMNSFENKRDFGAGETDKRKTSNSWDNNTSRISSYACNENKVDTCNKIKAEKQSHGVCYPGEYADPRRQADDTGIYIDSLVDSLNASGNRSSNSVNADIAKACANKSSNSVSVQLPRTQSLSPIYPVKSLEPQSHRQQDESESDSETIVINLVSGSASDTSTLKNETD